MGRLVAAGAVAAGAQVRALTRDPGAAAALLPPEAERVAGDLRRPEGLAAALRGVEALYLFAVPETAAEVVDAAKRAGVRRVVTLSSGAVTFGIDTTFHLPVERAVEASGVAWTHVRPGEFMLNRLWTWGPSIRAERTVRDPTPDAAWAPVHERDIAEVALTALLEEGHEGAAYTLNGPGILSRRAQAEAIGAALGEEVRFERVTPEQAREEYRALGGFAAEHADLLLGFRDYDGSPTDPTALDDHPFEGPLPTAADVLHRPARTFAQWAHDHAEDFR